MRGNLTNLAVLCIIFSMSEDEKTTEESQNENAVITAASQTAGGVMVKLFGPVANEMGQDLVHWYRAKRKANLDKILPKAVQKAEAAGAQRVQPPVGVIIPMIEKASLEEDAFMQEKWAALLAASVNPAMVEKMHKSFPHILEQMSPKDAMLLESVYHGYKKNGPDAFTHMKEDKYHVYANNLIRLGLCKYGTRPGVMSQGDITFSLVADPNKYIAITAMGIAFVECCHP